MAGKSKSRGGLGRGLSALLGASYEEPIFESKNDSKDEHDGSSSSKDELNNSLDKAGVQSASPEGDSQKNASNAKEEKKLTDEVPIEHIEPNPGQPRSHFKKEELEELASSIEREGLLQPILVRTIGENKYQIIAGERRWQACKSIGLKTVPVRIKEVADDKVLELALVENIQRCDLNPIEEAWAYKRIMDHKKLSQTDLAVMMSKGRSTITNTLRLLDLPEDAQQLLFEEKITAGHARAILSVTDPVYRQKLTEKLVSEKLSVRETESIARLFNNRPDPANAKSASVPQSYKAAARDLEKRFGAKVRVKRSGGKNRIEIPFENEEDLQRIFKMMMNEDSDNVSADE